MIIIIPTDTCYGLAGDISSREEYLEIYRLKGREFSKRLAILVKDWDMLRKYSEITDDQIGFLQRYPHPWSIILNKKESMVLPEYLDADQYTHISFRVASVGLCHRKGGSDPEKQKGISHNNWIASPARNDRYGDLNFPLWLTSANLSGHPESTTLAEAISYFPGVLGYDGGVCDRPPSDIFSIGADGELQYVRRNY